MPGLAYNGCSTTGHSTYPPTTIVSSQSKVFVQGNAICVEGDTIITHTNTVKPYDSHSGTLIPSTNKNYVTGKKAIMMGDKVSCGDTVIQSSGKVFIK